MTAEVTPTNHTRAGQMMRRLASGEDTIPNNPADARAYLRANGVNVPNNIDPVFITDEGSVFHIVVRNSQTMEDRFNEISEDDGDYSFPPNLEVNYGDYFGDRESYEGPAPAKAKRQRLFHDRIGDYTFGSCA